MRIGMNLIPLRPGQMGGAEVYFRDLLAELLKRGEHEYVLVTADYNHDTLPADSARVPTRPLRARGRGRCGAVPGIAGCCAAGWPGCAEYNRLVPVDARDMRPPVRCDPESGRGHMMSRGLDRLRSRGRRRRSDSLRELIRRERHRPLVLSVHQSRAARLPRARA